MISNYSVDKYPYVEAPNYFDINSIIESFPHLKDINADRDWTELNNAEGLIIRSANDDNVHKGIKYGIWTTTPKNRIKLQQAFLKNKQIFMFFSVVKSGMFEGVARLSSGIHEETFPYWWDDHTLKFKCFFKIQWIFIKDVNYKHFEGLLNTEGEDIAKSKDCDSVDEQTTRAMLEIFQKKPMKNKWIFNDFEYMDKRQKNYTRPIVNQQMIQTQEYQNYGYYNNGFNPYQGNQPQMMPLPPQMMRPMQNNMPPPRGDLGFQMNPLSKNRKK